VNRGIRRSPSDAADASFRELTWHDAKESMHKDLERLVKTAQPSRMQVS